uniref:EF-hand domain-containing protein n=1 Tax=Globodera rostochiensis TaxID=31243 RepID=A0A914HBV9_GLORO
MFFENFKFVFIKLLVLAKIGHVSSCITSINRDGCCSVIGHALFGCPGMSKPDCNIFGTFPFCGTPQFSWGGGHKTAKYHIFDHNCVVCKYVYNDACTVRVLCSCYYCCDPQYAEDCPNGCRECVKDGEGGCPENSAAVSFKAIGNSSSSMLEAEEAKAWEHFVTIDVDKNGSISLNEAIDHLVTKLNNGTSAKHLAKNVSWFAVMDSNGNNQIEPGEFDRSLIKVNKLDERLNE